MVVFVTSSPKFFQTPLLGCTQSNHSHPHPQSLCRGRPVQDFLCCSSSLIFSNMDKFLSQHETYSCNFTAERENKPVRHKIHQKHIKWKPKLHHNSPSVSNYCHLLFSEQTVSPSDVLECTVSLSLLPLVESAEHLVVERGLFLRDLVTITVVLKLFLALDAEKKFTPSTIQFLSVISMIGKGMNKNKPLPCPVCWFSAKYEWKKTKHHICLF